MKTIFKAGLLALMLFGLSCKETDNAPAPEGTTSETTLSPDHPTSRTAPPAKSHRTYYKHTPEKKKLTQHQIDSIKTERGALVTPSENVGASLTPGSGNAVPGNDKTGPGTPANMGSSAKTND